MSKSILPKYRKSLENISCGAPKGHNYVRFYSIQLKSDDVPESRKKLPQMACIVRLKRKKKNIKLIFFSVFKLGQNDPQTLFVTRACK